MFPDRSREVFCGSPLWQYGLSFKSGQLLEDSFQLFPKADATNNLRADSQNFTFGLSPVGTPSEFNFHPTRINGYSPPDTNSDPTSMDVDQLPTGSSITPQTKIIPENTSSLIPRKPKRKQVPTVISENKKSKHNASDINEESRKTLTRLNELLDEKGINIELDIYFFAQIRNRRHTLDEIFHQLSSCENEFIQMVEEFTQLGFATTQITRLLRGSTYNLSLAITMLINCKVYLSGLLELGFTNPELSSIFGDSGLLIENNIIEFNNVFNKLLSHQKKLPNYEKREFIDILIYSYRTKKAVKGRVKIFQEMKGMLAQFNSPA